jgi:hypothetical protein
MFFTTRIQSGPCPLCRRPPPLSSPAHNPPRTCSETWTSRNFNPSGNLISCPPTNRSRALLCLSPNPTKTRAPPPVPRQIHLHNTLHVLACLLHSYTRTETLSVLACLLHSYTPHHTTHTDTHQHTRTDTGRTLPNTLYIATDSRPVPHFTSCLF